ncbi:hypothetical protein M0638_07120 [Roseomonas sp. NAR14]|uniref:Uncharacterized protein n=1 Tax=Roseomonas acroporae TaxID=2937791 RepID=A0A9X1Y611_9PROT|nr:hypothetical protein [Roseomonas acroporae]MCK8784146.1 hypothetical protein [Roseomonas acroporae]
MADAHPIASPPRGELALPRARASRRNALTGAGAALLLLAAVEAGAGKAAELDGELITASAEYTRLAAGRATSPALLRELEERIAALPARTPEGIRAKAEAAFLAMAAGGAVADGPAGTDSWLPWSLVLDLTGRAGA